MAKNEHQGTNRRDFLQRMSAVAMWSAVSNGTALAGSNSLRGYAYVGSLGSPGCDHLDVFRVEGPRWTHKQRVQCPAPVSLVLHPNRQFLYVANSVAEHEDLPRGTVEVFSIAPQNGDLFRVQRRPLSLSGTEPRSLTITSDGQNLVVAVYSGGAYNVLPVLENGRLGPPKTIFKELGSSVHAKRQSSAHPHTVLWDTKGRFLLTSDLGCDQLNVFALTQEGALARKSRMQVAPGSGPGSMVLHPGGSWLYVKHELKPAITCHRFRYPEGIIDEPFETVLLPHPQEEEVPVQDSLTMDAKGRLLCATSPNGPMVWAIDPASGSLFIRQPRPFTDAFYPSQYQDAICALDTKTGSVLQMSSDSIGGEWDNMTQVACVSSPVSLALLSC